MSKEFIELVKDNPDLPIFAWVDCEVVQGDSMRWSGQFGNAEVLEYANVEPYGYNDTPIVFKNDTEDYLQHLIDNDLENKTEEELETEIEALDYKKAIFVNVDLPNNL